MLATIRFWNNNHSEKALFHDRKFTYYFRDILDKFNKFIDASDKNDIQVIPKYNDNQVEMSFIISNKQLKKLNFENKFDIKNNILFCFLPLIDFKQYRDDVNATYKMEFWRVVEGEFIYFPPNNQDEILDNKGAITVYARKDIIYSNIKDLNSVELFVNRSTDFLPSTENLQICSPLCVYKNETKKQISKDIIKTYDRRIPEYETVMAIDTADPTQANTYFRNFGKFWSDGISSVLSYVPDKSYGNYGTLKTFWKSFRAHEKFGSTSFYKVSSQFGGSTGAYPVITYDYDGFRGGSLSSAYGHVYSVPLNKTHFQITSISTAGTSGSERFIALLPGDYKLSDVSGTFKTTQIITNSGKIDSKKFYFTYERGSDYNTITYAIREGLYNYLNFNNLYENQFIKTAKAIAEGMGLKFQILQILKTRNRKTSTTITHKVGSTHVYGFQYVGPQTKKSDELSFVKIVIYDTLDSSDPYINKQSVLYSRETPFNNHGDAAHIHKVIVGNRIGVFPLDRRYNYKESVSGTGGTTLAVYNAECSELHDIGSINVEQMKVEAVESILLNVQKERERFNKLQALQSRHALTRNIINTATSFLDLSTIMKPNQDYGNPAPIKVDIPEDYIGEKTGGISEGMKRTGPRIPTLTKTMVSPARTEFLQAAAQGLPLALGGSFAAMGIRSVFRGAMSAVQGGVSTSQEREKAQLQMQLKEQQALNIAINISYDLEQQFPWLNRDSIYLLTYTTGDKEMITKDRLRYGNFINEFKFFYQFGGIKNGYYSVNIENTDGAQLYNLPIAEAEIFKVLLKNGIFGNADTLNRFASNDLPQYAEKGD